MFTQPILLPPKLTLYPFSLHACTQRSWGPQERTCVRCWPRKQVTGPPSGEESSQQCLKTERPKGPSDKVHDS